MNHELSISFPGRPEPVPGPVPGAAERLLVARDYGEIGFPDAPRDRTSIAEIDRISVRVRASCSELVVLGEDADTRGILALATAVSTPDGLPIRLHRGDEDPPDSAAYLFVARGREPGTAFADGEPIRERIREQSGPAWRERVIIITDPARGELREEAARTGVATLNYPIAVTGPESLLTPVGLLPAAVAGADPEAILDAALAAQDRTDTAPFATNPAQRLAAALLDGPGWVVPAPGTERLRGIAAWLSLFLASGPGDPASPEAVPIHLDPADAPRNGIVIHGGGSPAALIQTLLVGVALAKRAVAGGDA